MMIAWGVDYSFGVFFTPMIVEFGWRGSLINMREFIPIDEMVSQKPLLLGVNTAKRHSYALHGHRLSQELPYLATTKERPVPRKRVQFHVRLGIKKGGLNGQEILHTGTDHQQAPRGRNTA
jgi:hypothetical protein